MKTKVLSLFIVIFLFSLTKAQDIEAGQKTFKTICTACHTIGKGKLVGPDLKGVTDRLDHEWIKSFVKNSTAMVEAGDEEAVKIFNEYNQIPMPPNPTFSDDDLNNLVAYLADASVEKAVAPPPTTTETKTSGVVAQNTPIVVTTPADSVIDNPLIRMVFWGSVFIIITVLLSLTAVFVKLSNNNN